MHIPDFTLGREVTAEQHAFLDTHGFLRFAGVASPLEVQVLRDAIAELEARFVAEGRTHLHGIPLKFGRHEDGRPLIHRFAFTSRYSAAFHDFVHDSRLEPLRRLCGEDARLGDLEKDGVVVNAFCNHPGSAYSRLGWHTDGLRDLFYLQMPKRMLNVGVYLDDSTPEKGGLRVLPGTHTQGVWPILTRKLYFLDNGADPTEVFVGAKAGDLTIHDGRLWHRTARAELTGPSSLRRTLYVPFVTGPRVPKTEASATPAYHYLQRLVG